MLLLFDLNSNLLEQLSRTLASWKGGQRDPAELWYTLGVALRNVGLYREAIAALERSMEEGGDGPVAFRAALFLARIATLQGNWERAKQLLNWARDRARDERDQLNVATVWAGLLLHQSQVKDAVESLKTTIQSLMAQKQHLAQDHPMAWAYALVSYGGALTLTGHLDEAHRLLHEALNALATVPNKKRSQSLGMILAYINLGEVYRLQGQYDKAQEVLQTAMDLAAKYDFHEFLHSAHLNLAHTLVDAGQDLDRAQGLLKKAQDFYEDLRQKGTASPADLVEVQFVQAKLLWLQGRREEAVSTAQRALAQAVEYTLKDKEAHIAETLYHWTHRHTYRNQAIRAYESIGNIQRSEALQKGK